MFIFKGFIYFLQQHAKILLFHVIFIVNEKLCKFLQILILTSFSKFLQYVDFFLARFSNYFEDMSDKKFNIFQLV